MASPPRKKGCPAIMLSLTCAIIAFCIVGWHNAEVLGTLCALPTPERPRFEPQAAQTSDGKCNCTLEYDASSGAIRPNVSCSCTEDACSPIVTEKIVVRQEMPPIADMVREIVKEVAKSGNLSSVDESADSGSGKKTPRKSESAEDRPDPPPEKPIVIEHKPWFVENRTWHYPMRLPRCSMDACFNFSRCDGVDELKIFVYDLPSPPVRYFSKINDTKFFTGDPDRACLFFVFLDAPGPWNPHPKELAHWNGGLNHVLVSFADMWKQKGPPQETIGMASIMVSDMHETTYRAGFDISIPLPANYHLHEFLELRPFERKYFLTFRGLRYLGHSGEGVFRSHDSFRNLHNGDDVIVATSCKHFINDLNREKEPALGAHCDDDEKIHANTTFNDLMNSTFGLVPAGIQPASYRFIEVLSAGSVPVLIADNYVKPFDTLIHWHKCLIQFPTTEMHRIVGSLRAIPREHVAIRQQNCLTIYQEFLKDDSTLMKSSIRALKARFMGVFPALAELT
ncbi:protein MpGT47.14 [Marchantia polymorpha subsp. ruderalis]|uniref:Exostosin GT47 domain-containing protein n=2 Tax=Marchantia polymorpha TaxID=3197 RepID=A0AAF6BJG3_MARPO|nr:hypothetical protein MARPO_0084s0026 [Marchantia polymorpha]BBN12147.1 hypothetical protein Mp_5g17760 [Marchantia polymorpha subsp. ruderalis]|eukprot:PTQ33936.1 hypothetical protein MARPO_0084s0026 [Marchantia polymorpha]